MQIEQTLQQAVALHQGGRETEAADLYGAILGIQPKHAEANHNLGIVLPHGGQIQAAISHLLTALESDPARAQFWLSYIEALALAGQADAAREVLQLGRQQRLQGEVVSALAARLSVTSTATRSVNSGKPTQVQQDELVTMFNQGRFADTAVRARALTEQFPGNGFGWKVLGLALKQTGKNDEAIPAMRKAASRSPKEADVHSNLGVALHDAGQLREAEPR